MEQLIRTELDDFKKNIKRVSSHRVHRISNSMGVYDCYKTLRKNHWYNIGRPLTEKEFYSIIRTINNYLAEELSRGNDIILPYRMGKLEVRKYEPYVKLINNKVVTNRPIDWNKTLELWYNNKEAKDKKILIKSTPQYIFLIRYNKSNAEYINKSVFTFNISRTVKLLLKDNINKNNTDAFLCGKI